MLMALLRNIILFASLLVIGPAAGWLLSIVHAPDGAVRTTPLNSASPLMALVLAVVGLVAALTAGCIPARLYGARPGMSTFGIVAGWMALRTANIDELLRDSASPSRALVRLAIEGAIFGVIGLAGMFVLERAGWPVDKVLHPQRDGRPGSLKLLARPAGVQALLAAIAAGGAVGWLVAIESLRGQAVMAGVCAGIAAGAAAYLALTATLPHGERPASAGDSALVAMCAIAVLAIVGPLSALVLQGGSGAAAAAVKGNLFSLANLNGLDWIAGGMMGVPIGLGWAGASVEKHAPATAL